MSPPRKSECPGGAGQIAKQTSENGGIVAPDARACKVQVGATAMRAAGGDRK
jgi:hypothetical protein